MGVRWSQDRGPGSRGASIRSSDGGSKEVVCLRGRGRYRDGWYVKDGSEREGRRSEVVLQWGEMSNGGEPRRSGVSTGGRSTGEGLQ